MHPLPHSRTATASLPELSSMSTSTGSEEKLATEPMLLPAVKLNEEEIPSMTGWLVALDSIESVIVPEKPLVRRKSVRSSIKLY